MKKLSVLILLLFSLAFSEEFKVNNMTLVEGGTFKMGSRDGRGNERPVHKVTVSSFYISKYEVTNAEYCQFLNDYKSDKVKNGEYSGKIMINYLGHCTLEKCRIIKSGSSYLVEKGYEDYPVIYVTWYGANEYCKWLSAKTGLNYRLPTEAEWEYAARGGNKSRGYKYAGSDNPNDVAWCSGNSGGRAHPVGKKKPNELGLYDMSGNVYEWCSDWYGDYSREPINNPTGASTGSGRVYRGGAHGWVDFYGLVTKRYSTSPQHSRDDIGFRLVIPTPVK